MSTGLPSNVFSLWRWCYFQVRPKRRLQNLNKSLKEDGGAYGIESSVDDGEHVSLKNYEKYSAVNAVTKATAKLR